MKKHIDKIIVAASGYFDPIHAGHIEYLEKAKQVEWWFKNGESKINSRFVNGIL